jgi:hypothetical protein
MTISIQQARIATLYVGCLNGPADPAGLAYWVARLDEGMPPVQNVQSFSIERRRQDQLSAGARLRRRGDLSISFESESGSRSAAKAFMDAVHSRPSHID